MAPVSEQPQDRALVRRAAVVATGTLSSRLLGLLRDAVIAASFARFATDAFFIAFTIPNTLRMILGEGAASGAFVPVLSEVREKEGEPRARAFLAALAGRMFAILAAVTAVGMLVAPALVTLYAAGYLDDPSKLSLTISLTRSVFPYIFWMGMAALGMAALHTYQRFVVPSFAPALLNVSLIAAALALPAWLTTHEIPAIFALALGAIAGGLLQAMAQLPALRKAGVLAWPRLRRDPYATKALRLLVPLLVGVGVYQLNIMFSRQLASFLPTGAVSYLYYSQRLVEVPQGVFALAIASASLPSLSALRNRGDESKVHETWSRSMRLALFVAIPSSIALMVLAEPIVAVLFGRGEFEAGAVHQTARALFWQATGVWAVACVRTTIPLFHAYNDTRSPVVASAVNLGVFLLAALTLMKPFAHVGIAGAIALAAVGQFLALLWLARSRTEAVFWKAIGTSSWKWTLAGFALAAATFSIMSAGGEAATLGTVERALWLAAALGAGAGAYLTVSWLLNSPELNELAAAFGRRKRR